MTVNDTQLIEVQNLTESTVTFNDNDAGLKRRISFNGYETMKLPAGMLRRLNFSRGGSVLLRDYLSVKNRELAKEFGVTDDSFENEYNWTKDDIHEALTKGSLDELKDALDFAPEGVIETIVEVAIAERINDMAKREAIFEKTGRNVDQAIKNAEAEIAALAREAAAKGEKLESAPTRRRVSKKVESAEGEEPAERRASK